MPDDPAAPLTPPRICASRRGRRQSRPRRLGPPPGAPARPGEPSTLADRPRGRRVAGRRRPVPVGLRARLAQGTTPGHAGRRAGRVPAVLGRLPLDHPATTPAGRSTARSSIEGAIRGMIAALGDPFSAYLSPDEYRQSLQGLSGRFEGIGATVEARRLTGEGACPTLGDGCGLVVVEPIAGRAGREGGVCSPATGSRPSTGHGRRADLGPGPGARSAGPEGHDGGPDPRPRHGATPFDLPIVRDVIVQTGGQREDAGRRHGRLHPSDRVQRPGGRRTFGRAVGGRRRRRTHEADRRPARQPGRVRDRRSAGHQPVRPGRDDDLLPAGRSRASGRRRPALRRRRSPPTRRSRSSC